MIWIAVKTSGSAAGLVAAAEGAAVLCFGLLGGVYADRWNKRITMIAVDLIRAVMVLILPLLALNGLLQFWHLVVVSFIIGAVGSLFDPSLQASLSALSGDDQGTLQATNALMVLPVAWPALWGRRWLGCSWYFYRWRISSRSTPSVMSLYGIVCANRFRSITFA